MTTTMNPANPTSPTSRHTDVAPRFEGMKVTQARVIASEWTKFRSLRSTNITLLISAVLTVGLGAAISAAANVLASQESSASPQDLGAFDPVGISLSGVGIAQLAVGVLGVLLVSGEYATGMIRASLTAVPRRLPVLWGKFAVFAGVVGTISLASTFGAFFLGQALMSSRGVQASITDPDALRMVIGAAGYLVLVGFIGMALGALLRNTAAGISTLVALLFVIPPLMSLLPQSWGGAIGPYLPSSAGEAFWSIPFGDQLSPLAGFAVLCGWAAVAVAAAAITLKRRDA